MNARFVRRVELPVSAAEAFAWHERNGAFERLAPPWESISVVRKQGTIRNGDEITIRMRLAGIPMYWVAEHYDFQEGRQFADRSLRGPFALWNHVHQFTPQADGCVLEDAITYRLPGGFLGRWFGSGHAVRTLERMFNYRHHITKYDMTAHAKHTAAQTIAITGASGMVGRQLAPFLTTGGHRVISLGRPGSRSKLPSVGEQSTWNAETGEIGSTEPLDAVVHLAGENIADKRWNEKRKQAIRNSRVEGTRKLCQHLARREVKPQVLVCASAIGFYGDRGEETLTEESSEGTGFLPEVCRAWEEATSPAAEAGIRVVNLRIGIVLSPKGGALASMLTPFRLGGGGVIGSGKQYWSWIALDDLIGAMHHALFTESLRGPVNATTPNPVTNREFTKTLGKVLHRPTMIPLPAFAARLALGEMADELILASAKVMPSRLSESGYEFRLPELEGALRHLLGAT